MSLIVIFSAQAVTFAKSSPEETRAKLDMMSEQVLERVTQKYPSARSAVKSAYAYCTISCSSVKLGFLGDDHGRGVAINNNTGERIYVKMKEVSLDISLDAK